MRLTPAFNYDSNGKSSNSLSLSLIANPTIVARMDILGRDETCTVEISFHLIRIFASEILFDTRGERNIFFFSIPIWIRLWWSILDSIVKIFIIRYLYLFMYIRYDIIFKDVSFASDRCFLLVIEGLGLRSSRRSKIADTIFSPRS